MKGVLIYMAIISSLLTLFGCNKVPSAQVGQDSEAHHITARLNHLLMPLDRGDRYEDPLNEALSQRRLGEVTGGGTMQEKSGEIEFIDIEVDLTDLDVGVPFVIRKLEELGAPKGSILRIHGAEPQKEIPFGKAEGIAVYLDGVSLPEEVYQKSDVNRVIEKFNSRLGSHGSMQSHWQGPRETALYLYGDNAERMKTLIQDVLDSYPLCKGARVVTIAPKFKTTMN
ncbi:hypothetical protein GMSM_45870 [Geomonas sp. Red276]